jgi:hypothetical protein
VNHLRILVLTLLALVLASTASVVAPACEVYEPPPTPVIGGLEGGLLYDSKAPLVVSFGEPIDLATLDFKVARNETNLEGDLPDEDDDPSTELHVLLSHDPSNGDVGGNLTLDADGAGLSFTPEAALPVGPKLVLIVEPGLRGTGGRVRHNRTKIPFSYTVRCSQGTRAEKLKSGVYFVLLEVEQPLGTQIQLYGAIDIDPATGAFVGQFTNGDRSLDSSRCAGGCKDIERCRLLPSPACVVPSTRAGTSDEYTDFVPNVEPPTGYSFPVQGCAVDDGAGSGVLTAPATMVVQSPQVTVEGLTMTAFFAPDPKGVVRATGSLTADAVYLGTTKLGAGKGTMTATYIPDALVPPGVPRPVKQSVDAGANGGTDAGR